MPYIGNNIRSADDYRLIDDVSSSFNGSTTSFPLQVSGVSPAPFPKSPQQVLISVNGVIQEPDPTGTAGFNIVGNNIVFSSAPANGQAFFGIIYATADYINAGGTFPAGSSNLPSITFSADTDTGLYRKASGTVGFVSDGTEVGSFDSNGINSSALNITGTVSSNAMSVTGTVTANAFSGDGSALTNLPSSGGTVGPGTEKLFVEAENQMDASFATQQNFNYVAASPMTIASGAVLTISANSTMTFV